MKTFLCIVLKMLHFSKVLRSSQSQLN
jgi:hypothetical protein